MPKRLSKSQPTPTVGSWLSVSYQPVSLFSLKRSDATSMAARSNLVPTPYAIKMALLKVLLESQGHLHQTDFDTWSDRQFTWIRDLQIYIQPPERLVVNRNSYKLRYWNQQADKDYRKTNNKEPPPISPMQDGFVFREWVYLEGTLQICCGPSDSEALLRSPLALPKASADHAQDLERLFAQINYFGKRGCFFQYLPALTVQTPQPQWQPNPNQSFTVQPMDDLGEKSTFSRINPFSTQKAQLNKDRVIKPGFLPLELMASSARYDFYQRI